MQTKIIDQDAKQAASLPNYNVDYQAFFLPFQLQNNGDVFQGCLEAKGDALSSLSVSTTFVF